MCFSRLCLLVKSSPHSGHISFASSSWTFMCARRRLVVRKIFVQLFTAQGICGLIVVCMIVIWSRRVLDPLNDVLQCWQTHFDLSRSEKCIFSLWLENDWYDSKVERHSLHSKLCWDCEYSLISQVLFSSSAWLFI